MLLIPTFIKINSTTVLVNRSVAYSSELVLLIKHQMWGGAPKLQLPTTWSTASFSATFRPAVGSQFIPDARPTR